jgi:hypothetical protein
MAGSLSSFGSHSQVIMGCWECGSVVECLTSVCESLGSILSTTHTHTHTHIHTHISHQRGVLWLHKLYPLHLTSLYFSFSGLINIWHIIGLFIYLFSISHHPPP